MKKINYIKKALLPVTFVAAILIMASCGYNQKPNDNRVDAREQNNDGVVVEDQNEVKFVNNNQENDAQFLVKAAEINLKEIQLGQLAQQKGGSAQVKELGKMMEDAHTKSLNDLTALAKSKMITIPSSSTDNAQDAYKELNEKSDNDFDKAYVDLMVSEHKDAIEAFEDASTDSNDSDIKNWATVSLPGLRSHLNHSVDLQNNLTANNSLNN
jgi:putative membrane protein